MGKKLREVCPRGAHAVWKAPTNRPDPVSLVLEADNGRVPELLPLRHGRMAVSPFTFYRGSANKRESNRLVGGTLRRHRIGPSVNYSASRP